MASAHLKPQKPRNTKRPVRSGVVALPLSQRVAISSRLNQHEQSLVYREHAASKRKTRAKRKTPKAPKPWSPPLSNRQIERQHQLAKIARNKAKARARRASLSNDGGMK